MGMGNAFMGDAPIMSGHWYNPKSGDSFTVRDTYFEDNNLIVMTTDGRRLDYNLIQQYVQTEKPMPKRPVDGPEVNNNSIIGGLPKEVADLLAEDPGLTPQPTQVIQQTPTIQTTTMTAPIVNAAPVAKPVEDEDALMIRKMLSRGASPGVKIDINWIKYPTKQMEMLVEYMGIDIEKIADYYISQLSLEDIKQNLAREITNYIAAKQIAEAEIEGNTYQAAAPQKVVNEAAKVAEQKGEKYYLDENGQVKLTQTGLATAPSVATPKPVAKPAPAKKPAPKKPVAKKKAPAKKPAPKKK